MLRRLVECVGGLGTVIVMVLPLCEKVAITRCVFALHVLCARACRRGPEEFVTEEVLQFIGVSAYGYCFGYVFRRDTVSPRKYGLPLSMREAPRAQPQSVLSRLATSRRPSTSFTVRLRLEK